MSDELLRLIAEGSPSLTADHVDFLQKLARGAELYRAEFVQPDAEWAHEPPSFLFEYRLEVYDFSSVLPWLLRFEDELFARGVRMDSLEDEAARGSTLLLDNMRFADARFGHDYTNALLTQYVEAKFGSIPAIAQTLQHISRQHVSTSRPEYRECSQYINHSLSGYANSLRLQLRYDKESAYRVVVSAVWSLLDRRHSLSHRGLF